jgi:hypothetical protein
MVCGDGTTGCHGWIEDHPLEAATEGFHVWSHEEPVAVQIKLWHLPVKVYLDDTGCWAFDRVPVLEDNG